MVTNRCDFISGVYPAASEQIMFFGKTPSAPASFQRRWLKRLMWAGAAILILAAFVGTKAKNFISESGGGESAETRAKIKTLQLILEARRLVDGHYPSQEAGLESVLPGGTGAKAQERAAARLKDAWQRKIRYRIPGEHHRDSYDLFSLGPDGLEGTEDDITNW
jgi:general secretion pathway protein G